MQRIKLNWIIGIVFALLFGSLLMVRLGVFQSEEDGMIDLASVSQISSGHETWMSIFQNDQKIGYAHRQFILTAEGYRIIESVSLGINTLGMVQEIRYRTSGNLDPHFALSTFDFELQSSLFNFKARGGVEGKRLVFSGGPTGSEQKVEVPIDHKVYLPLGIMESIHQERLKPGDHRTFHVFDPMSMAQRPVKVTFLAEEDIAVMGRVERGKKISVDFMGVPQFAWVGREGKVLKEEGSLGIRLVRTTREEALRKGAISSSADLAEIVSVAANKSFSDVDGMNELRVRLDGVEKKGLFLDGDRQGYKDGILTVRKESLSGLPARAEDGILLERQRHLESTPFIQSTHPEILARAKTIVSQGDPEVVMARKLIAWVYRNIQKRPVISVPNALETLRHKVGDCNEHAVLLAALARALGIPAQVEAGLVYQKGRFYYHAWNVLHIGKWITADSAMGQFPADVTHLRFVRGAEQQIDLMGIIGQVRLEILSETR